MTSAKRLTLIAFSVITCLFVVSQLHTLAIRAQSAQVETAYDQPKMKLQNLSSYWRETLELSVKTPEFLRIANARKVTVQLGKTYFDLAAEHMKPLRALAKRVGP